MTKENYTLKEPIVVNGEQVSTLTLRSMKVRDLKQINHIDDDLDKSIHLIAKLADLTPENIEDISAADFTELSEEQMARLRPFSKERRSKIRGGMNTKFYAVANAHGRPIRLKKMMLIGCVKHWCI